MRWMVPSRWVPAAAVPNATRATAAVSVARGDTTIVGIRRTWSGGQPPQGGRRPPRRRGATDWDTPAPRAGAPPRLEVERGGRREEDGRLFRGGRALGRGGRLHRAAGRARLRGAVGDPRAG